MSTLREPVVCNRPRAARRAAWWALLAGVLLGHGVATLWLRANLVGWGSGEAPLPQRMEVAFVQALAPAAPPPARSAAAPAPRKKAHARVRAVTPAASAPDAPAVDAAEAAASAPPPVPAGEAALQPEPEMQAAASAPAASAPEAVAAAASAPAAPPFEWPPSTRLSYVLTGNYRGEVHGNARVQWVRQGTRYQVHLDVTIGPGFAPLISRRTTSEGELGEQGLVPQRYDEATRALFQAPRHATLLFTPDQVTLANGSVHEALPGVQDAASQFVQLTWLFTTRPELLRAGNTVSLPLALPRRQGHWVFDVLSQERLVTPVGELDTYHLKPRLGSRQPGNELSAEIWFAPTLQYLPVRIRIQQDADTYVDLLLAGAPMQAAPAAADPAPP